MRVLGLALAGALALTAPIGVQAGSLGPGWYPMPNGWNGDWRRATGPSPMERRIGFAALVSELFSSRVGLLCGAWCPHLLGLGSQRRRLRLSLYGLAWSDRWLGQSIADWCSVPPARVSIRPMRSHTAV
jgi:hypothetical protein